MLHIVPGVGVSIRGDTRPAVDGMAGFAIGIGRLKMICRSIIQMTGNAASLYNRMIDLYHRRKLQGVMAILASVFGSNMVGGFTGGPGTVMAGKTIIGQCGVIRLCRRPIDGVMAGVTLFGGGDMIGRHGIDMATTTGADYRTVIYPHHRRKCIKIGMTITARFGGVDMIGRLAHHHRIVVTRAANTHHGIMIDFHHLCEEAVFVMTVVTCGGRINVILRFTDGYSVVVTTGADTRHDVIVIHFTHRRKSVEIIMTRFTGVLCTDVVGGFAHSGAVIMAAETISGNPFMMGTGNGGQPCHRAVAILAIRRGNHMIGRLAFGDDIVVTGGANTIYIGMIKSH